MVLGGKMDTALFEPFLLFGREVVLTPWKIIGIVGAILFASRWLVQVYYSRLAGKPVTPRIFWVMSIIGSVMCLAYFTLSHKPDMVGVLQNLFPSVIAAYNLYLDLTHRRKEDAEARAAAAQAAAQTPAPAPALESVSAP